MNPPDVPSPFDQPSPSNERFKLELTGVAVISFLVMAAVVTLVSPPGPAVGGSAEKFAPSAEPVDEGAGVLRITLDCSDRARVVHYDLDADPDGEWDVACKRHRLLLPDGSELPKWYRYRMSAHRLEPTGETYELRTPAGSPISLRPDGYYCEDETAGCLTLRYRFLEPVVAPPRGRDEP